MEFQPHDATQLPFLERLIFFYKFCSCEMQHRIHFWWRFFPHKELTQIYVSVAIRSFAISLISLFIPLYLYKELGYTFDATLLFFLLYSAVFAASSPLAAVFAGKFGVKHTVLLSVPLYILFLVLLAFLPFFLVPLWILSVLFGVSFAFYWMGMHLLFYHASSHKHRGEQFGIRTAVSVLATLLGPFLGGVIIASWGFFAVFFCASLLLLSSVYFLFLSQEDHVRYHFSFRVIFNRRHWKDALFFMSQGTRAIADGVLWPLFVFAILGSYVSLGVVGSLLTGLSAILIWCMGRYSDHENKRTIVSWITPFESLSWFLRAFVSSVGQVFGVTLLGAVTHGVREAPLGALEYDKAQGQIAEYFVSREIYICLGRILLLAVVLMTHSLQGGFIVEGVSSLAALLF